MNKLEQMVADGIFPMTFFNYGGPDGESGRVESIQDWLELGFTVPQSPQFGGGPDDVRKMRRLLDACDEAGLKMILCDRRGNYGLFQREGEEKFRQGFAQAVQDFADHPAVFGFDVGDEPSRERIPSAFRANAVQKELAPELSPFLNHGPYSPGGAEWMGLRSFGTYLDDYCVQGKADFLCFDVYWQMLPGEQGVEDYYRCLKMYADAARRQNKRLWITLLCCGHYEYRCPSEDDFRWQINTAVAHGCTGISWFTVYIGPDFQNYRVAPFTLGKRTQTFEWLSRVSTIFQNHHGSLMVKLKLQKVWHVGKAYGGYPGTIDSELVKGAKAKFPVILSEFKDPQGRDYVAVVNNSFDTSGQVVVTWHGEPNILRVGWKGGEAKARTAVDDANPANPAALTGPWLAPGQMEVYRIESEGGE